MNPLAWTARKRRSTYDVVFYVPWVTSLLLAEGSAPVKALPPAGGAETQIFLLSGALAARGARICLCVFDIPGTSIPTSRDGVDIAVRRPYLGGRGTLGRLREAWVVRRELTRISADVVVTRTAGPHVGLIGLFAKLSRQRFIYSSASLPDFNFAALLPAVRDRMLYRLGIHLADGIVVQTEEQAQLCRKMMGRAPVVIKSIAEVVPERTGSPEAFVWIGRLDENKRPMEFVELARSLPEAKFWMVAVPHEPQLMEAVERAAARTPNLELLEPRPRAQVLELIDCAVAVVSTSEFEGMPNVFLEGWARGVPALALSHDPDGVIERQGLGKFARGSREDFVAAARKLWEGRDDQAEVAQRCRSYIAEEHSEEAVASRWVNVLALARQVPATSPATAEVS